MQDADFSNSGHVTWPFLQCFTRYVDDWSLARVKVNVYRGRQEFRNMLPSLDAPKEATHCAEVRRIFST